MRKRGLVVGLAGIAIAVAGCGSDDDDNGGQASVPAKPAESEAMPSADTGATLAVSSPSGGATVSENEVPFGVTLSDFDVDCRFAGTPNEDGVGHYHVELDGKLINMFCSDSDSVSLQNVEPGEHKLQFIPATNDHMDDFDAEQDVSFTYQPTSPLPEITAEEASGKPSIQIVSPKPGSTVSGSFVMRVAPSNFEFSCDLYGKDNVAGYGHWHANVDTTTEGMMGMGTMLGMSCERTFKVSLAGIDPGKHEFFAILEDNQHAPTPKAQDAVTLNVQ